MANSGKKELLIKLARPGKPVVTVKGKNGLTLGTDYACALTINEAFLPPSYTFVKGGGKEPFTLRITDKIDGTIRLGEEKTSIGLLLRMGVLPKDKGFRLLEIHPEAAVELVFPSGTVLQIACSATPSVPSAKPLPQLIKEQLSLGAIPRRERMFFAILLFSVLFYGAFAIFLQTIEIQKKDSLEELKSLSPRFAKLILTPKKEVKKPEPAQKAKEETKKEEEPKKEKEKEEAKKTDEVTPERKKIREKVAKTGVLGIIASKGGVMSDASSNADLWRDVDKLIKGSNTISEAGDPLAGLEGTHTGVSGEDLDEGLKNKKTAADLLKEKKDSASFKNAGKDKESIDITRQEAEVYRIVKSYIGGLKYIYNNELKNNPSLKGAVTVEITISNEGRVTSAKITKSTVNYKPFEDAIIERILLWRFNKLVGVKEFNINYTFDFSPVG